MSGTKKKTGASRSPKAPARAVYGPKLAAEVVALARTRSRLIAKMRQSAAEAESEAESAFDLDIDGDEDAVPTGDRQDAMAIVLGAAFERATDARTMRRLHHSQALACVVRVPTAAWLAPTATWFAATFGTRWRLKTYERPRGASIATDGEIEAARELASGRCLVGFCTDEKHLPAPLLATADIVVELSAPDGDALRRSVTRFCRRPPSSLPPRFGAGLDLMDIVACMRPGTGPDRIVARLAKASVARSETLTEERLPEISTAVEYGSAREWILQVAKDAAGYFEKSIGWQDFRAPAICIASEPGIGKTVFAKAAARHLGIPIVSVVTADWFAQRSYIEDVLRSIRETWDRCRALVRAHGLCLLHIDECEGIPNRATMDGRNREYFSVIMGDLLCRLEMGSPQRHGIILCATTNRPEGVDAALLRPGRFERLVVLERPGFEGTLSMLRFQVGEESGIAEEEMRAVARMAEFSTGAEIMSLVKAARHQARAAGETFGAAHLRAAMFAPQEVEWRICVHEAGHAVVPLATGFGTLLHAAVGATVGSAHRTAIDYDGPAVVTRRQIEAQAVMKLGGRAAERALLGDMSAGAQTDLRTATALVAAMHLSWGLRGTTAYVASPDEAAAAIAADPDLRARVEADLARLQKRADRLAARHLPAIEAIAHALRERRHVGGDEARGLFDRHASSDARRRTAVGRRPGRLRPPVPPAPARSAAAPAAAGPEPSRNSNP